MTNREKVLEVYNFNEEQAKRYDEFVTFMIAYEFEKKLNYYDMENNGNEQ